MNDEELKQLWRQQELAAPVAGPDTEIVARMKKKMRKFDKTIFWRDVRELAACAIVFFGYGLSYVRESYPVARAGCIVFMLSAVFIAGKILYARRGEKRFRHPASVREFLLGEVEKVSRQIRLLETVIWWYLPPLFIGWELCQWGAPGTVLGKILMTLFFMLLCAFLHWLNRYAARKSLAPLKRELEQTLQSMPEFLEPANQNKTNP
jgi:hypothetical protein